MAYARFSDELYGKRPEAEDRRLGNNILSIIGLIMRIKIYYSSTPLLVPSFPVFGLYFLIIYCKRVRRLGSRVLGVLT